MASVPLTWLGHAAFRLDTPTGERIYVDPFLQGNPSCPDGEREPERIDLIVLTHGHDDHLGDTIALAQRFGCPVVGSVELRGWLSTQGLPEAPEHAINKGGGIDIAGARVTMTHAHHSSSVFRDGTFVYLGEAAGLVIEVQDASTIYFAGDTDAFTDMQLIARIYQPDVAVLPIGDHYTMGPREAAVALELLGNPRCMPCHYGTFGLLTGTPEELRSLAPDADLVIPHPGETIEV